MYVCMLILSPILAKNKLRIRGLDWSDHAVYWCHIVYLGRTCTFAHAPLEWTFYVEIDYSARTEMPPAWACHTCTYTYSLDNLSICSCGLLAWIYSTIERVLWYSDNNTCMHFNSMHCMYTRTSLPWLYTMIVSRTASTEWWFMLLLSPPWIAAGSSGELKHFLSAKHSTPMLWRVPLWRCNHMHVHFTLLNTNYLSNGEVYKLYVCFSLHNYIFCLLEHFLQFVHLLSLCWLV